MPAELDDSLGVVSATNQEAARSQTKIDQLSAEARRALEEYRNLRNGAEYQAAFTAELEQLQQQQEDQIASLRQQIEAARITRQRIVPLMNSMADALEQFVLLDLPFHQQERVAAVLQLKQRLRQPSLAVSTRFRLLLEAYQLEQDYGNTIEAWRGKVTLDEQPVAVEFLRIGRVALYYRSLDGAQVAYWDTRARDWHPLQPEASPSIERAMQVARKQVAPALLVLPMVAPGAPS